MRRNQNFWTRKVTYFLRLFIIISFFFAFHFSSFVISHLFAAAIDLLLSLLPDQKLLQVFHLNFWAFLSISSMGILGKIFSSSRIWVQMTPILVKGDDIKSRTKGNTCRWVRSNHLRFDEIAFRRSRLLSKCWNFNTLSIIAMFNVVVITKLDRWYLFLLTFPTKRTVFVISPSPTYSRLMILPVCLSTTRMINKKG